MTYHCRHQLMIAYYGNSTLMGFEQRVTYLARQTGAPKGEHSYLLQNLLGRVFMFAETYLIDSLQTEASLQ